LLSPRTLLGLGTNVQFADEIGQGVTEGKVIDVAGAGFVDAVAVWHGRVVVEESAVLCAVEPDEECLSARGTDE
jgi:hypothetical protein